MQQCLCNGWGPAAVVRTGRKKNRCCWHPDNGLSLILHSICSICKGVFLLKGWQLCLYRMCFPAVLEILTHSASTLTSQTTSHIFRHIIIDHNKNNTLESETVIWGDSWGIAQSNNYALCLAWLHNAWTIFGRRFDSFVRLRWRAWL